MRHDCLHPLIQLVSCDCVTPCIAAHLPAPMCLIAAGLAAGWLTVPAMAVFAFIFLGIDEIGVEIEVCS